MKIRTGIGYDVHKLVENRPLILGGVTVPHELGLLGHSDADVLIHAICDALLGAAALGDIGQQFPDTDPKYANIDSRILLRQTAALLDEKGFSIGNIDATIVAQKPKLKPFIPQMVANVASDLKLSSEDVSVKATTTEWLGFEGREEGISSLSTCLIYVR